MVAAKAFDSTIGKFQEQPVLLDAVLEGFVGRLMARAKELVLDPAKDADDPHAPRGVGLGARFLYVAHAVRTLCSVRGHKSVVKLMPHEVAELEPVLGALRAEDRSDHATWETKYVLLFWLSQLVIIPFDLSSVDSTIVGDGAAAEGGLVETVIRIARSYLADSGATREAVGVLLGARAGVDCELES